ncbi:hypothetical protein AJ79_07526 [Helicocarpus griseus UAMH5409]|uniref:Arrestin-like N-terminal domain-containing protein n=1 Tax=Helicocarpus griseus UAMH5409 TaxID=1447875 RepID=A0A2B7X203_9EURO|nr:hypothetical protein AJ79_07526 [Helicocarpus griseus UAMH5409]
MAPPADLRILLDNPQTCYVPGDELTGQVILSAHDSLDISSIGIEFHGLESVRYNSVYQENCLFRTEETLFTGPYTLRKNKYSYPFQFVFPATASPPDESTRSGYVTPSPHTLPPSTKHHRIGATYSFDANIKYELVVAVKRQKRLGSGEKILLESGLELMFWPTVDDSTATVPQYECFSCSMPVSYDPSCYPEPPPEYPGDKTEETATVYEKGVGKKEETENYPKAKPPPEYPRNSKQEGKPNSKKQELAKEEERTSENENENSKEAHNNRQSRISRLFSSLKPTNSSSPPPSLPTAQADIIIQFPTTLLRDQPNPLRLHANYPITHQIPPIKLTRLTIELQAIVHVPCFERTLYGAKPGRGEEKHVLKSTVVEDTEAIDLDLPVLPATDQSPLEISLFDNPLRQFARLKADFTTYNVARTHTISVKFHFRCGEQTISWEKGDIVVFIQPASERPPVEYFVPDDPDDKHWMARVMS